MARSEEEKGFERRMVKERSKVIDAFVDKVQQKELERERRLGLAREKAAQIWCQPETEECVMDVAIAQAFAEVLVEEMYTPRLGCATTGELLEELKARVEVDGSLGYSTIPSFRALTR